MTVIHASVACLVRVRRVVTTRAGGGSAAAVRLVQPGRPRRRRPERRVRPTATAWPPSSAWPRTSWSGWSRSTAAPRPSWTVRKPRRRGDRRPGHGDPGPRARGARRRLRPDPAGRRRGRGGRARCTPGRVGARVGVVPGRRRPPWSKPAPRSAGSRRCWARRSAVTATRSPPRCPPTSRRTCRAAPARPARAPPAWTCAPGSGGSSPTLGVAQDRRRPAVHDRGQDAVQPPPGRDHRPDRRRITWMRGMTESATGRAELAESWPRPCASGSRPPAGPPARSGRRGQAARGHQDLPRRPTSPLLADLGVTDFGENRDQEAPARRRAEARRAAPGRRPCAGTWSAGCSATRPGPWWAGRTRSSPWTRPARRRAREGRARGP